MANIISMIILTIIKDNANQRILEALSDITKKRAGGLEGKCKHSPKAGEVVV